MLRDYQQAAFDAVKSHIKECKDSCVIEAPTGAGKSHIVAAIADWVAGFGDQYRTLCLAPSKELVEQNYAKFLATGNPASIYSASVGRKELRNPVIFGTPTTVLNSIDKFPKITCVVVDEAHGITPTIKTIISKLTKAYKDLRVVGLTATPYRTGEGYIYRIDENSKPETDIKDPYYTKLIYKICPWYLIQQSYLTPPISGEIPERYDTSGLKKNSFGKYDARSVEQTFEGKGRLTSYIVKDIVKQSAGRLGVLIFAATVNHAREVLASLPLGSEIITGKTPKAERERIINAFKQQKFKYLVNVAVLTTGFDAPHADVVAILRKTESPGLLQQMVGRGLRLNEGKTDCLVLDYASNIQDHCPAGDIFAPDLNVTGTPKETDSIKVSCPACKSQNKFKGRPNEGGWDIDINGYFVDLAGKYIVNEYDDPIPAHFGRRCFGMALNTESKEYERCSYRWTFKECPECEHANDIAARVCESCGAELIDPNEKLKLHVDQIRKDPYETTSDKVLSWSLSFHTSQAGNDTLRVNYTTEFRTFSVWYLPRKKRLWDDLCYACFGKVCPDVETFLEYRLLAKMPETITVQKQRDSQFYNVYAHNRPETSIEQISKNIR